MHVGCNFQPKMQTYTFKFIKMKAYLEAQNIHKQYYNHLALDDVSIAVPEQSIFGLLGPNGAGKSTLIRIINRIIIQDSGQVFLNGKTMDDLMVKHIGYLPEERGLYKKMKVGEQILYLAQLKGLSEKDAKINVGEWFERFDITSWWNKKVEDLSKGMQQKLQFIVSVVHRPGLLIFDEPFSGFDPVNAEIITSEILRLNREGATIIFSTHRMETVEALCNYITLINKSKVVLEGSLSEVRKKFRSHHYQVEMEEVKDNYFELLSSLNPKDLKKTDILKFSFDIRMDHNINDYIIKLLDVGRILKIEEKVPTLSEIFIQTVTDKKLSIHE
jgi:ABC-2 type transport system ATP-binding protein